MPFDLRPHAAQCPNCGEYITGDGYTVVFHCPDADIDKVMQTTPDDNPVYCMPSTSAS